MHTKHIENITELSASGKHQECLQACLNLLKKHPMEIVAWKFAGKSSLALGQLEKAQHYQSKAHQLDGSDPETIKDIGNIFNALQNEAEATRMYKAALSIDQNYAPAIHNLGLVARQQGNLVKAEQLMRQARDLDPNFAPYNLNLGSICRIRGNLNEALALTLRSLELKPDNPDALMNLGGIHMHLGNLDKALTPTLKSLELKPDSPTAHLNLGGIHIHLGNLDKALASTLESLKLKPKSSAAHMNLGTIYMELSNRDLAKKNTLKSLEINPNQKFAAWNLYGLSASIQEANEAIDLCLEIDPNFTDAMALKAALKLHQGDTSMLNSLNQSSPERGGLSRSVNWVASLKKLPSLFFNRWQLFDFAISQSITSRPFYECGVWNGHSFQYLVKYLKNGYGFDTFTGLPEKWHNEPEGTYSANGMLPNIQGGTFIKGLFEETLPQFFAAPRPPASIINFDADLYSSTLCALHHARPVIDQHTILIFDEFIVNSNWEQDEYKALNEYCEINKIDYDVIAVSYFTKQVAVKLIY